MRPTVKSGHCDGFGESELFSEVFLCLSIGPQ